MEVHQVASVDVQESVVLCDLAPLNRTEVHEENVVVMRPTSGHVQVPKQGQRVLVEEADNGIKYIIGVAERNENGKNPSVTEEGTMGIQFDGGTKILFDKVGGGYEITIQSSQDIDIDAEGEVTIDATGDVKIDGIDFDQHTHDYEDSTINDTGDGSGSESTTTKTSETPQ